MQVLTRIRQVDFSRHWPYVAITLAALAVTAIVGSAVLTYGSKVNRMLAVLAMLRDVGARYSTSGWETPRELAEGLLSTADSVSRRETTILYLNEAADSINDEWIRKHADEFALLPGVTIVLNQTAVTDDGMRHLTQLKNLNKLYLIGTAIGDDTLSSLEAHQRISMLELSNTRVTDAGLVFVRSLPSLRHLSIANTDVTSGGLQHLTGLWNLDSLEVDGVQASGPGLDVLAELRLTKTLVLRGRLVDDTTVNNIARLSHVQHLTVYGPGVSDACIPALLRMESLRYITLVDTNVTDEGLAKLQQVFSAANAQRRTLPAEFQHYSRN
jgi:hypothetical protein